MLTKQDFELSISCSKLCLPLLSLPLLWALSLSLVLHSPSESLFSICASCLQLTLQFPWDCSDFSVHGIAGPQNLFKSKKKSPNDFSKLSTNSDWYLSWHQDMKIHFLYWTLQVLLNRVSCRIRTHLLNNHCICITSVPQGSGMLLAWAHSTYYAELWTAPANRQHPFVIWEVSLASLWGDFWVHSYLDIIYPQISTFISQYSYCLDRLLGHIL